MGQLQTYLQLLLRWNQRINLTSIREPEECVTRHFGECFFLKSHEQIRGRLLDIGSGAGFPGLALKLVFPDCEATLLEPVAKKRAFLKEVARCCEIEGVEVRPERLEEIPALGLRFDVATARAVARPETLAIQAGSVLDSSGWIHFWTTRSQAEKLEKAGVGISWTRRLPIPLSHEREILTGTITSQTP
ncbi:MAG: 16S rRNA (guanine(527)-N(7))-methyltransferase RsmG [Terriglobia bacterium]